MTTYSLPKKLTVSILSVTVMQLSDMVESVTLDMESARCIMTFLSLRFERLQGKIGFFGIDGRFKGTEGQLCHTEGQFQSTEGHLCSTEGQLCSFRTMQVKL